MDKVAIYARVSTVDNQNYDRQVYELTQEIIRQGYQKEQIEIFAEQLSGYQKDRPELTRMLGEIEIEPNKYKTIFITEISRLGRNPSNTREIIDKLISQGVPVYIKSIGQATIDDKGKRNVIVSIILQVLMEFADLEAQQMKDRMKSGKMKRAADGKTSSSNLPYGYTSDDKGVIIIDDEEKEIIEQIFEMYSNGMGTRVIANTLNQLNIPTKLNKSKGDKLMKFNKETSLKIADEIRWSDVVVGQILKNTIYKGERKYKDATFSSPVIISPELFDQCNKLMTTKSTRNYLTTYDYLLKDLVRCGCCGRKYMGKYVNKPKGDKVYRCTSNIKAGEGCGNRSLNMSLFESVIYDQVLLSPTLLSALDNPNDLVNELKITLTNNKQLLKNEEDNLQGKEKQLENLLRTLTMSKNPNFELYSQMEGEILGEIDLLKNKIKLLKKDIFQKTSTIENFNIEATSTEMIKNASRGELVNIFKQFIQQIYLNDLANGWVLADVVIKIRGVVLIRTLKLFIFADGVRKFGGRNEKVYKYLPVTKMENDPVYKENILLNDIKDIREEFENLKYLAEIPHTLTDVRLNNVEMKNRLFINEFDL